MVRFQALFLVVLILLQTFSRELLVLDYQVHKERVTKLFCVNKDKPALHCNGKCHLAKQLRKTSDSESKAPTVGFGKVKYEVVAPILYQIAAMQRLKLVPVPYASATSVRYTFTPIHGVFHPPAFRI